MKREPKSDEAQSHRESRSVYDFLYHDARRVGSYLAQFEASGLLQSVKRTVSAEETESSRAGATAGAKIPALAVASGQFEDAVGSVSREASEKQYDPYWTNAVSLLTYLQQHELLLSDVREARIGQFVLAGGGLSLLDLGMMRQAWILPTVQKAARAGMTVGAKQQVASGPKGMPNPVDLILELLSVLPHPAQAKLTTDDLAIWCSLDPASMVTTSADLLLKHGTRVAGEWHVLGVLDAMPEDPVGAVVEQFMRTGGLAAAAPQTQIVATIIEQLAPTIRGLLGRPPDAYGVTPLLIFREVSG